EIPSNLMLERVGARKWLARIMITWGLAAAGCMFVTGPWSLIGMRMLVGIAEAGFSPGLVLFLTYWYPQYRRAGAQTIPMIGQPIAGMFGALVGGLILGMHGVWGLAGWRWLFLLKACRRSFWASSCCSISPTSRRTRLSSRPRRKRRSPACWSATRRSAGAPSRRR